MFLRVIAPLLRLRLVGVVVGVGVGVGIRVRVRVINQPHAQFFFSFGVMALQRNDSV